MELPLDREMTGFGWEHPSLDGSKHWVGLDQVLDKEMQCLQRQTHIILL